MGAVNGSMKVDGVGIETYIDKSTCVSLHFNECGGGSDVDVVGEVS